MKKDQGKNLPWSFRTLPEAVKRRLRRPTAPEGFAIGNVVAFFGFCPQDVNTRCEAQEVALFILDGHDRLCYNSEKTTKKSKNAFVT